MPSVRTPLFRVMPNFRRTDNNAATTTDDLQWQPVIGIVAGFRKYPWVLPYISDMKADCVDMSISQ